MRSSASSGSGAVDSNEESVAAVGRGVGNVLAGDWNHAGSFLPGALGDQLLDPETERLEIGRNDERQLVAARAGAGADGEAERRRRVRERGAETRFSGGEHCHAPAEQTCDIDAHQRRRHKTEKRQR